MLLFWTKEKGSFGKRRIVEDESQFFGFQLSSTWEKQGCFSSKEYAHYTGTASTRQALRYTYACAHVQRFTSDMAWDSKPRTSACYSMSSELHSAIRTTEKQNHQSLQSASWPLPLLLLPLRKGTDV